MTDLDPRVESALSLFLYEAAQSGGTFTNPRDLIRIVLEGADEKDPLRQGDTMPIDRAILREVRYWLRVSMGGRREHAANLLNRLPDPDQDPQP